MNKNKIAGLVLAGAIISGASTGATTNIIKTPTKTKNSTNNEVLLASDQSSSMDSTGVVINGNNSLILKNNINGSITSYLSVGEMLKVTAKEGNYYKVTVEETGATGYISSKNVQLITTGNSKEFQSLNETGHVVNVTSEVHLRGKASLNSNVIGFLKNGTQFKIIGKEGQWYKIDADGHIGFIYEEYVAKTPNETTTTTTTNTEKQINNTKNSNTEANISNITTSTNSNNTTIKVKAEPTAATTETQNKKTQESTNTINNTNKETTINQPKKSTTNNTTANNTTANNDNNSSSSATGTTVTENTGSTTITLINSSTGKPMANQDVTINNNKLTTNSKGTVTLIKLNDGINKLNITSTGFNPTSATVNIKAGENVSTNVQLTPNKGTVLLKFINANSSRALSNINVSIDGTNYTTNSNGDVLITDLKPGNQTLTVSAKGFNQTTVTINVNNQGQVSGNVNLYQKSNIEAPIAMKVVSPTLNSNTTKVTSTNATKPNNNSTTNNNSANNNSTTTTGNATLTFINPNTGEAIANQVISIDGVNYTTNAKGAIVINNVKPGNHTLQVSSNGFNNTTVELNLDNNSQISGNVNLYPKVAEKTSTKTNKSSADKITPSVKDNTINVKPSTTNTVKANNNTDSTITTGSATLTFINPNTGEAIANQVISIDGTNYTTNANGSIVVNNIKPGNHTLQVSSNGFNNTSVELNLDNNSKISGNVNLYPNPNVAKKASTKTNKSSADKITPNNNNNNTTTKSNVNTNSAVTTGSATLTFVNPNTGDIIANQTISIGGTNYTTNANGSIVVNNIKPGNHTLQISSNGFNNTSVELNLNNNNEISGKVNLYPKITQQPKVATNNNNNNNNNNNSSNNNNNNNSNNSNNSNNNSNNSNSSQSTAALQQAIVNYAEQYLGCPYVWGASGPNEFDCSGLTSYVYSHFGYNIGRTTYQQINAGVPVSLNDLQPGDLLFFGNPQAPDHVVMYIGNHEYIQAPQPGQNVDISSWDWGGIVAARRIV